MAEKSLGVCVICGKEIKSKWNAVQKDGLWVCALGCSGKYGKEKASWSPEKWKELRDRQADYDQAGKEVVLHEKVIEALEGQKVLGFVKGFGLKSLTPTFVVTENGVFIYDPKLTGAKKVSIPFAQIMGVSYWLEMGNPHFSVDTQSGSTELMLSGGKKDTHEPALKLFYLLRDKLSEMSGVPISESHDKGMIKEKWSFLAPAKISFIQAQPKSSSGDSIPDQIKKLAELRDAGILTSEEFEDKKKQLLAQM